MILTEVTEQIKRKVREIASTAWELSVMLETSQMTLKARALC